MMQPWSRCSVETYYGNTSKRSKNYRKDFKRKAVVMALIDEDKGAVRAFHFANGIGANKVREIIVTNASRKSTLVTDESRLYTKLGNEFADHQTVIHTGNEYISKDDFT